jgi:hypothetical protein
MSDRLIHIAAYFVIRRFRGGEYPTLRIRAEVNRKGIQDIAVKVFNDLGENHRWAFVVISEQRREEQLIVDSRLRSNFEVFRKANLWPLTWEVFDMTGGTVWTFSGTVLDTQLCIDDPSRFGFDVRHATNAEPMLAELLSFCTKQTGTVKEPPDDTILAVQHPTNEWAAAARAFSEASSDGSPHAGAQDYPRAVIYSSGHFGRDYGSPMPNAPPGIRTGALGAMSLCR